MERRFCLRDGAFGDMEGRFFLQNGAVSDMKGLQDGAVGDKEGGVVDDRGEGGVRIEPCSTDWSLHSMAVSDCSPT